MLEGMGVLNPPLRAFRKDWALPVDQLGEGARYYQHDPAEARRLLAAAGYPQGFPASLCFTSYGSTALVDILQFVLKDLTCFYRKSDSMLLGLYTSFFEPHGELYGKYTPGEPKNQSHVSAPS